MQYDGVRKHSYRTREQVAGEVMSTDLNRSYKKTMKIE